MDTVPVSHLTLQTFIRIFYTVKNTHNKNLKCSKVSVLVTVIYFIWAKVWSEHPFSYSTLSKASRAFWKLFWMYQHSRPKPIRTGIDSWWLWYGPWPKRSLTRSYVENSCLVQTILFRCLWFQPLLPDLSQVSKIKSTFWILKTIYVFQPKVKSPNF